MATMTAPPASTPAAEVTGRKRCDDTPGEREHEQLWYPVLGLGIPAASFLVSWRLHGGTASTYRIDCQWSAFTGLFILALAIERALEPFSAKLGPDKARRTSRGEAEMCRRLTAVVTLGGGDRPWLPSVRRAEYHAVAGGPCQRFRAAAVLGRSAGHRSCRWRRHQAAARSGRQH